MNKYVLLLRGINVGGNTKVSMTDLKKILESLGCKNVRTILNSGNAVFEHTETNLNSLAEKIEGELEKTFGFKISVIIRTNAEIEKLIQKDPFKNIKMTPTIRPNVTFVKEKPTTNLKIPYKSPDFSIVAMFGHEICSIIDLSSGKGSPDIMKFLEKEFGKNITTRTWNTVQKLI